MIIFMNVEEHKLDNDPEVVQQFKDDITEGTFHMAEGTSIPLVFNDERYVAYRMRPGSEDYKKGHIMVVHVWRLW